MFIKRKQKTLTFMVSEPKLNFSRNSEKYKAPYFLTGEPHF